MNSQMLPVWGQAFCRDPVQPPLGHGDGAGAWRPGPWLSPSGETRKGPLKGGGLTWTSQSIQNDGLLFQGVWAVILVYLWGPQRSMTGLMKERVVGFPRRSQKRHGCLAVQ